MDIGKWVQSPAGIGQVWSKAEPGYSPRPHRRWWIADGERFYVYPESQLIELAGPDEEPPTLFEESA